MNSPSKEKPNIDEGTVGGRKATDGQRMADFLGLLKRRIMGASTYSWQGLKACFEHEEAFRVEVFFAVLLLPLALVIAATPVELVLLIGSVVLVLIVELLNSAIEAVVDRISEEQHELAGRAKDQGSAAVMLSMGLFGLTCLLVCLS
jgi:diacylglycerol kinase (ATP)